MTTENIILWIIFWFCKYCCSKQATSCLMIRFRRSWVCSTIYWTWKLRLNLENCFWMNKKRYWVYFWVFYWRDQIFMRWIKITLQKLLIWYYQGLLRLWLHMTIKFWSFLWSICGRKLWRRIMVNYPNLNSNFLSFSFYTWNLGKIWRSVYFWERKFKQFEILPFLQMKRNIWN